MKKITLGLAMCGSFCTFSRVLDAFEALDREIYDFVPVMSKISFETDSRFGPAAQFRERLVPDLAALQDLLLVPENEVCTSII